MDTRTLTSLLQNTSLLHDVPAEELHDEASRYPYSSLLQTLLVKKYQLDGDIGLETALARAALLHPDRKELYHFMESPLSNTIKETEKEKEEQSQAALEEVVEEANVPVDIPVENEIPIPVEEEIRIKEVPPLAQPTTSPELEKNEPIVQQQQVAAHQLLDIEKDRMSFAEWLKRVREGAVQDANNLNRIIQTGSYAATLVHEGNEEKPKKPAITKRAPKEQMHTQVDQMAQKSVAFDDELVTETLARIFELQKKYSKALDSYEKLMVRYPEKKMQFQAAIDRLKTKLG